MDTIELQLVNNFYNLKQGREVLNQLLTDKIKYLKLKKLSSEVSYEHTPTNISDRLKELQIAQEQLNSFFANLQNKDYEVEIDCPIRIVLHKTDGNKSNQSIEHQIA